MRKRSLLLAALAFSTVIGAAAPAHAGWVWVPPHRTWNPYARSHFYMGLEGVGAIIVDQTGPNAFLDHGGGLGFFLGGRLSRHFALEFAWQGTFHGQPRHDLLNVFYPDQRFFLSAFTVDGKFYLADHQVQPYIDLGAGGYLLGDRASLFAEGPGFQVGGGVDVWLGYHASIGGKLLYRGIALIDYDPNRDDTFISMFTFAVDFTFRF